MNKFLLLLLVIFSLVGCGVNPKNIVNNSTVIIDNTEVLERLKNIEYDLQYVVNVYQKGLEKFSPKSIIFDERISCFPNGNCNFTVYEEYKFANNTRLRMFRLAYAKEELNTYDFEITDWKAIIMYDDECYIDTGTCSAKVDKVYSFNSKENAEIYLEKLLLKEEAE